MFQSKLFRDKNLLLPVLILGVFLLPMVTCTNSNPSRVPQSSPSLESLWTVTDVRTASNLAGPQAKDLFMEIRNEQLIYVDTGHPYALKSLILLTGDSNWESNLTKLPNAATINSNSVVLGGLLAPNERPNRDVSCENEWESDCSAIYLAAYNLESGQLLWSNAYSGMGLIDQIVADNSTLHLTGGGTKGSFYSELFVNATNGVLQSSQILTPEDISIPTKLPFQVEGISVKMASPMAYGDEFLAFVANNGSLWILDQEDKSVLAILDFDGPAVTDAVKVIVHKDIIIVYFRDSEQLFAFRFLPALSRYSLYAWAGF